MSIFQTIMSGYQLGKLQLNNRIALAPMTRVSAEENGLVNQKMVRYYANFAFGGMSLIITEGAYIDESCSQGYANQPGISNQRHVDAWKNLTDAVHGFGSKIICQIMHAGALSQNNYYTKETVGPSVVQPLGEQLAMYRGKGAYKLPQEITLAQIEEVIESFAASALRAKEAGFDGVEMHGANGYILDEFLTEYTNQRTDRYGGSTENRVRLSVEILEAVRRRVGPDFVVGIRISQSKVNDYIYKWKNGEKDAQIIFERLASAKPDYIHITEYNATKPAFGEEGPTLSYLARKYSGLTVIANGMLGEPQVAENMLATGQADIISLAKSALANPHWVKKVAEDQELEAFDGSVLQPIATVKERELL